MAEHQGDGFIQFSLDFITKTWLGRLKCVELLFTLLAGACGSSVRSWIGNGYGCGCVEKLSFFDFVAWTAFVNALIDIIIHLIGLWERILWFFRHPVLYLVLCGLAVLGFLIGSSLGASCAKRICVTSPSTAGVATFFGFVCLVLFAVEFFLHFQEYRIPQSESQHPRTGSFRPFKFLNHYFVHL